MSTLEPRALPPTAYRGWLKNGGRIMLRSWDVWVPLVFVLSCVGNALTQLAPVLILVLAASSGVVHGLNAAAAERYARKERFGWMGLLACWATEIRAFSPVLRRSLMVRSVTTLSFLLAFVALHATHGTASPETATAATTTSSVTTSIWFDFFLPWNNVWFFSLVLQAGGPLSMHYWLMTRCGVDAPTANRLFTQAFRKNLLGFCQLLLVAGILLIVGSVFPFLTVPFECFWVAVMCCAWNEIFMGKAQLETQEATQRAPSMVPQAG